MQYKDTIKEISSYLIKMNREMPNTMQAFGKLTHAGKDEGALDKKTKELIALAIGISTRCDACIGFHAKALVKMGATREEFLDMISVVVYMGGGPALMYAAKALKAFEEFQE